MWGDTTVAYAVLNEHLHVFTSWRSSLFPVLMAVIVMAYHWLEHPTMPIRWQLWMSFVMTVVATVSDAMVGVGVGVESCRQCCWR